MATNNNRNKLDNGATFIGVVIGLVVGGIYALLNIKHRGETTRKNLTQFGAGSLEEDMDSSLDIAKQQARQRRQESN